MNVSDERIEQGELLLQMIEEDPSSVVLHPVLDKKTDIIRLGVCIDKEDNEENVHSFMMGILLSSDDPLLEGMEFYSPGEAVLERPLPQTNIPTEKFLGVS